MLKFIDSVLQVTAQALILAIFFGALTATAIGLARLIQFLAAM